MRFMGKRSFAGADAAWRNLLFIRMHRAATAPARTSSLVARIERQDRASGSSGRRGRPRLRHTVLLGLPAAGMPEVGPALAGEPLGLGAPPVGDPGVVAGAEHVGDC